MTTVLMGAKPGHLVTVSGENVVRRAEAMRVDAVHSGGGWALCYAAVL